MDFEEYDTEWIDLILSARKMGLTMDDIRAFLRSPFQTTQKSQNSTENDPCMSP
ncbi:anti-repressor SinI family protein [Paenibacillus planticolens]|uniref:DNA-binding anti-repressor SinI n=1 Tax=Paenibacillus planticolens TaxID=2654976 RepID=A0ABX1ZJC7_9BACL|nr:anti-repressor SinI family protein [Paenibacillus planticolens]NOV00194.1 DNA-binding anti-repressor SinI [Paenibacillus planticolens]